MVLVGSLPRSISKIRKICVQRNTNRIASLLEVNPARLEKFVRFVLKNKSRSNHIGHYATIHFHQGISPKSNLDKVRNNLLAVARQEVDDGNFYHRIATRLLAHGSAGHTDEDLTREGGIVNAHIELEELILGAAAHALASEIDAVAHINHIVHTRHLHDVRLIVDKVGVGLDGGCHGVEIVAFLNLHIDHAAMNARARGDGHGEGGLHARHSLDSYGMPHRHAGAEVGISDTLGRDGLEEGAHDAIATGVPASGDDADGTGSLGTLVERAAELGDLGVDVETINGIDTQGKNFLGIGFHAAGGRAEEGNVNGAQFSNIANNGKAGQLGGTILCTLTAHDACNFKIGGLLQGLEGIVADIAVTYYGGSNLLHKDEWISLRG